MQHSKQEPDRSWRSINSWERFITKIPGIIRTTQTRETNDELHLEINIFCTSQNTQIFQHFSSRRVIISAKTPDGCDFISHGSFYQTRLCGETVIKTSLGCNFEKREALLMLGLKCKINTQRRNKRINPSGLAADKHLVLFFIASPRLQRSNPIDQKLFFFL